MMVAKSEGRSWSPSLSQRMLAILAASIVAVSAPAAFVFYWFSRDASIAEAEMFMQSSGDRRVLGLQYTLHLAEKSLARFDLMLRDAVALPPAPDEPALLHRELEVNGGGMWVSRPPETPQTAFAGIFIDPRAPGDEAFQRLHLRAQRLISVYAGAVVPPLDTLWLLTRSRSGVIYVPRDTGFLGRINLDRDYLQTQWLRLGDPAVNPDRALRWTRAEYDPVLQAWLVSALRPVDIDGAWIGTIGHDLYLDELTTRLVGPDDMPGTEHYLVDAEGGPIIAGRWQAMFGTSQLAPEQLAGFEQSVAALQAIASAAQDRSRPIHAELGGVSVAVLAREIPETGWRYFMVTPTASMAGGADRALMLFGLTASIAVILVAVVSHLLVRRQIVAPVRELAATVRRFAAGDAQARTRLDRSDDIGDLGRAFNAMADRITAAHDDLTLTQEELQHRNAALVHANRTKSNFLANMSHELRTPLNAIIGFAEILRHEMFGPLGSERYTGYVEDIQRSGQHLLSLINDILDMSKIEAGRQPMKLEQQSLRPLVERGLRMAQPMAEHRAVRLQLTADGEDLTANCDSRAVIQMVVNLVSNAVKFSPAGGTVQIRLDRSSFGGAKISVADNGPGIDESVLPHLFEAYAHRAAMTTSRYDGVGLGLAITKALIELHHGSIRVTTQPGRGTTMTVELPPTIP
jgi:signal transduction histidine kinase